LNILLISPFFYPDEIGIALYNKLTVEYLLKKKHDVSVITSVPYYPEWKIKTPYDSVTLFKKENYLGATVFRVKQFVPRRPTAFKRALQLMHFTILSFIYIFSVTKNSKIIVVTPFTSSIVIALLVRFFRGGKIWCHVQDFEFDAAVETLQLKLFKKSLFKIESILFDSCDSVSTISNAMLKKLGTKTTTQRILFPNFIDVETFNESFSKHSYFQSNQKPQLLYSGNIGEKQDWDFFVDFCREVSQDVDITIVGNGAMKESLQESLIECQNVRFFNLVPYSELPQLLCSFNGHILFQKKEVIDSVMPSKLIAMMLSGKPSFLYGNDLSESKMVAEKSEGALFYGGNNVKEFSALVKKIVLNKTHSKKIGDNARKYARQNFSENEILGRFEKNLQKL
jgi:colanic acid biosynthesis glycosyl transferase WcaI